MFFVDSNSPRLFIFARVCFRIWWFGKQMWGGVLGFVVGFTLMGNKCGGGVLGFVVGCGGLVNKCGEVVLVL